MTKEETIKQLKSLKADRESFIQNEKEHDKVFLEDIKAIETVLSMLEENDKEIKKINKGQQSLIQSRKKWKNRYYKTKRELRKKDKVIDLMSEQLTTPIHYKEWVKQYYENKAKE